MKTVSDWVDRQVKEGRWHEEILPATTTGLSRPVTVFRGQRKGHLIMHSKFGDETTFCPDNWHDLAIGSGACSLRCRACFLILTHRAFKDPNRHLLYDNFDAFILRVRQWLLEPERRRAHVLGIGTDRSDSLLYEGVVPYVRTLAPIFGSPKSNPKDCRMLLLTKTANSHFLAEIEEENRPFVIASFSLNPQGIADLWEGQWPNGERIPPTIAERIAAARHAQSLGYEVRVRVDPILWPTGWEGMYEKFARQVTEAGLSPVLWTLGLYRQKNNQLDTWRKKWGLPPLGWEPPREDFIKDGTHWRVPPERRATIYRTVIEHIHQVFPTAAVGLCKETRLVWRELGLRMRCNCMAH